MTDVLSPQDRPRVFRAFKFATAAGFDNAGRTYNTGNWLALSAAVAVAFAAGLDGSGYVAHLGLAFFGSLPALLVTAGSLAFFLGGARYDAAYGGPGKPDGSALKQGHGLSGLGAVLVGLGLAGLATTSLGAFAALGGGALHAAGKVGSAIDERRGVWKMLPLASRLFSLISVLGDLGDGPETARAMAAGILLVSIGVWARADMMLLSETQARLLATWLGLRRTEWSEAN